MRKTRQAGMALIVSLIILISMTLLGLAAIQNTSLEERMVGNLRSDTMAFEAAEAALRAAEATLTEQPIQPAAVVNPSSNPEVWPLNSPGEARSGLPIDTEWWVAWTRNDWKDFAVQLGEVLIYVAAKGEDGIAEQGTATSQTDPLAPRFVIEEQALRKDTMNLGQQRDYSGRYFYQITARGVDPGGRAESFVRGTYARRY